VAEPLAPRPRPQLRLLTGGAPASEPSYSDPELFEGIAKGDERVASALYRRLLPEVEAALLAVLERRDPRHDELVQHSFERMILTIARRRYAEACNLNTWASAVAAQIALGSLRARQRRRTVKLQPPSTLRAPGLEPAAAQRRAVEWLRAQLAGLPLARAEAVVLHDLMGHPLAEIATMMRLSLAATQSRLVRAHKDLTLALLADGVPGDGASLPPVSLPASSFPPAAQAALPPILRPALPRSSLRAVPARFAPGPTASGKPSSKLPDLEDLFVAWRALSREHARSSNIARGGSRVVARALRLVARRRRRIQHMSTLALGAGAVVTALGVGFGIWFAQRRLSGEAERPKAESRVLLASVLGDVAVSDREGHALSGFAPLAEGYGLRTDEGTARLGFASGAALSVAHHSRLAILSTQETEVFFLGIGSVEVDLPDLALGGSFAVETPDTHLTSRAAQFLVVVDPAGNTSTHVEVRTGQVLVRYAGHDLELQAGQSWPAPISTLDPEEDQGPEEH
jgi:DNA-directed RNA polymerase specialized sigma24 family protein